MADDIEMDSLEIDDSSGPLLDSPTEEEGGEKEKEEGIKAEVSETEKEMDKALDNGDLKDIKKWVTPQNLLNCTTNCILKSSEVSHRLKNLGESKRPNAKTFNKLATRVEDFAFHFLDPLKNDDLKRTIFQEKLFDRVTHTALEKGQKKFISHSVYHLMMRKRWTGIFYQMIYLQTGIKNWFKYALLRIWTSIDVFLFPLVHVVLWLIHLAIEFKKKRQDRRVIFWRHVTSATVQFKTTENDIKEQLARDRTKYDEIKTDKNQTRLTVKLFTDITRKTIRKGTKEEVLNLACKEAKNLFEEDKKGSKKVLVIMKDRIFEEAGRLEENLKSLKKQQNVVVISVGLISTTVLELDSTCLENWKTMKTDDENVFLIVDDDKDRSKIIQKICECIKGKDIYDRYVEYFKTPYFVFFRDILSYLTLVGLHFAMCLQPSTIHFTAVEWIISVFFLGRVMMEIDQVVMEKKWEKEAKEEKEAEEIPLKRLWKKLWKAMSAYFYNWWNKLDVLSLSAFLVIVGLRVFIWSQHSSVTNNRLLAVAGYLYGLNAMLLTLRVLGNILEYNKTTGSIQIALFHIFSAVMIIFGQFVVAIMAFSLAITKIYIAEASYFSGKNETSTGLCQNQKGLDCWWSFTIHLAWSLLGFADLTPLQSLDSISDGLAQTLYGLFLVMGVVMLMNMMIALLSNTYQRVEDNAFYEWLFKKAITIVTYSKYHSVPVPFNIISLSFLLIRHLYRKIKSKCCNPEDESQGGNSSIKAKEEKYLDLEKRLFQGLQMEYFATYGHRFPKKETEKDNSKIIGYVAKRAFCYDQREIYQLLKSHGQINEWDAKGIAIFDQQLLNAPCSDPECETSSGKLNIHGARYLSPLSKEYPEFEVLIQKTGEFRAIAIGVVTEEHDVHDFPGLMQNTVGYHIDEGKIIDDCDYYPPGRYGKNSMAYRGDVIGCKILFDEKEEDYLPVSFTLNGREVGKAKLLISSNRFFYPCVGIGCKGISLMFKMCPAYQKLGTIFGQQTEHLSTELKEGIDGVIQTLGTISEQLKQMSETQTELERKINHLSRPELYGEAESNWV